MIDYQQLSQEIIQYRRDLHQIPELGFYVYKTSAYVRNILSSLSCQIEEIVTTGLIAYFDFGQKETLAFRADMDALPIQEVTGAEYASVHDGCMHACGHDGHMATMLGFAKVVDDYKKSGTPLSHNVLLLFQPAEETIDGALRICGTHIFDQYHIAAIFGMHLWPMLSKGEIASRPGPMMARSTSVEVEFEGVSAHCGEPEKGKDALEAACRFISEVYSFKTMCIRDRCVLKFGKMRSGNVRNAISPHTRLDGTMRTFSDDTWADLVDIMETFGHQIEEEYGVTFSLDVSKSHPAVINNEDLYHKVKSSLLSLNYVELRKPVMIAEDFSFFEQQLPGIFFFLGTGSGIPLHSDNYDFDDTVLIDGVKLFDTLLKSGL
ncbi:MAG: M20 family metallopeptidase [Emergencia sp.]|nr:M20 family metallopeptidase [Emergencia sp.]